MKRLALALLIALPFQPCTLTTTTSAPTTLTGGPCRAPCTRRSSPPTGRFRSDVRCCPASRRRLRRQPGLRGGFRPYFGETADIRSLRRPRLGGQEAGQGVGGAARHAEAVGNALVDRRGLLGADLLGLHPAKPRATTSSSIRTPTSTRTPGRWTGRSKSC